MGERGGQSLKGNGGGRIREKGLGGNGRKSATKTL